MDKAQCLTDKTCACHPLFTDTDIAGLYEVAHLRQKKTSTTYSTGEACQVIAFHLLLRLTHTS